MVVYCACKHTNMDVIRLNHHLNEMVKKVSKEQKQILLIENLNINLLNYNVHQPTKGL